MGRARVAIWKSLYPDKFDVDGFGELFLEELDSWFTADIACCDACFDKYARDWPGLTNSVEFQSNGIPLELFYSGSCFHEIYTMEEFLDLCRKMGCPVCGQPLVCNIWPYNPPFNIPTGFEKEILELSERAARTPFLVLKHPLAKTVLKEILKLKKSLTPQTYPAAYFRARSINTPKEPAQFMPPPASKCGEGRYNHAGHPVLYLASDPEVAFKEVGAPVEGVLVAQVKFKKQLKILDLAHDSLAGDLLRAITASALLSAPSEKNGWDRPEYSFSRFVADCVVDAALSGIRYPSVAKSAGSNLVIFSPDCRWADLMEIGALSEYHPPK